MSAHEGDEIVNSVRFENLEALEAHISYLYFQVQNVLKGNLTTGALWTIAYKKFHKFLVSDEHIHAIKTVFSANQLTKSQNKLSTKIAMWLMDRTIKERAELLVKQQQENQSAITTANETKMPVVKSKLRYIAGSCIYKIRNRLRDSVDRNL